MATFEQDQPGKDLPPPQEGASLEEEAPTAARRVLSVAGQLWAWLFLILLGVFFSLSAPGFFSLFNFQSILANMAIALIMAVGQTFVIISAGIDLSTGYVMGLASVVAAMALNALGAQPVGIAVLGGLLAGLGAGALAGTVNGLVIARLRVPAFIVTLGMYSIARGFGFVLSGGLPVPVYPNVAQWGNGYLLYLYKGTLSFLNIPAGVTGAELRRVSGILPFPVLLMLVVIIICAWMLRRTRFGLYTYSIGGNEEASVRAGIPTQNHLTKVYMLSGLLAALAGVLFALRFTNGAANAGEALLLDSIAAVVIGGASLFGGEGTIIGTLIGTLIIAVIQNGFVILGINAFWQYVAVGSVIILAVLVDQAKARLVT
jgi:ribose/xylose/arabinose/galactoside ABC-type transport system permease subunit